MLWPPSYRLDVSDVIAAAARRSAFVRASKPPPRLSGR